MLTTFTNARNFTRLGTTNPADLDKARAAATTALGVLIPGEVVSAATLVSGSLSTKTDVDDGTTSWTNLHLAQILIVILGLFAIPLLFRVGSGAWWKNGWRGALLVLLTLVSFGVWLALQPLSIYQDRITLDQGEVAAVAVVAGVIIGGAAGLLGVSQASVTPSPQPPSPHPSPPPPPSGN